MQWTLSRAGGAAPETVWQRYVDLDAWAGWAPFISGVQAPSRELVAGLTGTVVGVGGLPVRFVVLAVDHPSRTWRWRAWLGPASLTLGHEVVDRPTGGSVAVLHLSGRLPVVAGYLGPAQLALRSLVRP
jgi:hypothetical protein